MDGNAQVSLELTDLAQRNSRLRQRAAQCSGSDPAAVLELGLAVLVHRALLVARSTVVLRWLDPAVGARIEEEQEQLGQDLRLLQELAASEPDSADVETLAEALVMRLRDRLAHDERVLQRPLERWLALGLSAGAGNGERTGAGPLGGAPPPSKRGETS